jgi:hypothetical protein
LAYDTLSKRQWAFAPRAPERESGDWSVQATAPIKRKKHGRPEQSIFSRGLELLASFLHGIATNLRQVALGGLLEEIGLTTARFPPKMLPLTDQWVDYSSGRAIAPTLQ